MQIVITLNVIAAGFFQHQVVTLSGSTPQVVIPVSDFPLDKAAVDRFIARYELETGVAEKMKKFYSDREFHPAWFTEDGLSEQTQAFWSDHNQYLRHIQDSSLFNRQLHEQVETLLESEAALPAADALSLELQLTQHFLEFVQQAYGGKTNPRSLQWHIPRKKVNAVALLDSLVNGNASSLEELAPLHSQYLLLKQALLNLYQVQQQHNWKPLSFGTRKVLRLGDSAEVVQELKIRLQLLGDLQPTDNSNSYNNNFVAAVKRFQQRHGLVQDGIAGPNFLRALNIPMQKRIEQILINMERMRWMPPQGEGTRLVANIPEFKLHVYEGQGKAMSMNIVVGKAANRTVVFSDSLQYVVFSPYWNIPNSIVRNELLPAMKRNPNYLKQHNMEITGERNGLPVIRQQPGPGNALGRVKFIFPNRFHIYLHDTPAKSLFNLNRRTFSHGCIRLESPAELAAYLLRDNSGWTREKVAQAMQQTNEEWIKVKEPVPVMITYFTAWVDETGKLHFRNDWYGHDKRLSRQLFQN